MAVIGGTMVADAFAQDYVPPREEVEWAMRFSGVSGPGRPVDGNGWGGWRSGADGVYYEGTTPRPEYNLNFQGKATGSAVKAGLVPPIKPALELHLRDGVVTLGGDGNYYLTGSSGDNIWAYAKGIELWKSADLKTWKYMGLVWDIDKEAGRWVKQWRKHPRRAVRAVWAPEIHYIKNNYYICYSMCPHGIGILKSSTGRPDGPYVNAFKTEGPVVDGIDATLFEDDNGQVYFTYASGTRIYRMKDDMSGFDGSPVSVNFAEPDHNATHHADKCVKRGMNDLGHEGAVLFKRGGKYYLGAADSYEGRYSTCLAVADSIYGPYRMRHESVPCGGGTGFFMDKAGNWWSSYFGNDTQTHFREKIGFVKVEFDADGRVLPAKDQPFVPEADRTEWERKWNAVWATRPPVRKTVALPGGKAAPIPDGPYKPTWASVKANYTTPQWLKDAKFGIFIHWGLYSVPAQGSEWYPRHMYNGLAKWHEEHFGRQDKFGYKDFIPMFKAENYVPANWAALFKDAGAKYVIMTAEHHDGFAMYDSKLTRWDAKDMGPCRDLLGDLCSAVRAEGLKFGLSNHRMENWDFMYPKVEYHDLYDPQYADFYGPPQKADPKNSAMGPGKEEVMEGIVKEAPQSEAFREEWLARNQELIDSYRPDILWFDNGVNSRSLDPVKLRLAAYYYNRAAQWGKLVTLSTKGQAYLAGTVTDYERQGRAPKEPTNHYWQVDEPIGHKFGYVNGLKLQSSSSVIRKLVENISRNGNLCLNISPRGDGIIPDDQQKVLREVGQWLKVNGEAVYGTTMWKISGEGPKIEGNKSQRDFRFTQKGNTLYAFMPGWKGGETMVKSLTREHTGKVKSVELLGYGKIKFKQLEDGLKLILPDNKPCRDIAVFKVTVK